jgi:threonine dehydratase
LKSDWNVSLFHYRNYGGDVGKVLVGLQVGENQQEAFQAFLNDVGYPYSEETNNPIYKQFLKSAS